jgi:hypothetical protein
MTVTYPNRTSLEAIVLSHEEHEIRAIAAGCDDVLVFTRIDGTWISDDEQPVTIEFVWQRQKASRVPSEDDCICSNELAARLIRTLFTGSEPEAAESEKLFVFGPQGTRVAIHLSELRTN